VVRVLAVVLALSTFMPWFTSRGSIDEDRYVGNPYPLIDWLVCGVALATAVVPRVARAALVVGAVSVSLTLLGLYVDRAEGLRSSVEYGFAVAALATVLLWSTLRRAPVEG
jgi:hypothetical protein